MLADWNLLQRERADAAKGTRRGSGGLGLLKRMAKQDVHIGEDAARFWGGRISVS